MAQVFPTKSNLMAQKRSLALASQGYDLMDRKRNILVREMMQLIDRAAVIQDEIATAYSSAYKALQRANITLGVVGEFAKTVPVETGLKLDYRSVMGVELPIVTIPVRPGRNLAGIVEIATMKNRQMKYGYNAARDFVTQFDSKVDEMMKEKQTER